MGSLLFVIIIIIVVVLLFKKISGKNTADSDELESTLALLESYYDTARANCDALDKKVISIGTYIREINGKGDLSSPFMAVCMSEGNNDNLASSLGMRVSVVGGKKRYQFVVERKLNKAAKYEVIKELAARLRKKYPNDVINTDKEGSVIFAMIDCKDVIELIHSAPK